jgi:hypothetical protein
MTLDFAKLREKLQASKDGNKGGTKGFLKLKKGDNVLRVVPSEDGDPFKKFFLHYNVGDALPFLCPQRNWQKPCPVCAFASQLWKEGTEESMAMAKKLFARDRYYSPAIIRKEEDKGVRWWSYGKEVYEYLIGLCLNPEYSDITDPETGIDLVIKYETPKGALYPKTKIEPRRHSTKICEGYTPETCKNLLDNVPNINSLLEKKSEQEIKDILAQHWMEESSQPEEESNTEESTEEKVVEEGKKEVKKYGNKKKEEVVEKKEEESSDVDEAFEELLGEE